MIKLRERAVRLTIALALAGLIASQIPVTGTVALAQNGYGSFSGEGDDNPNKVIVGGMLLITAYGLIVELTHKKD